MTATVYPTKEVTLGNFSLSPNKNINKILGHRIRDAREECGMTQAELGAVMEKPRSHTAICSIEKGKTRITVSLLIELARLLGQIPEDLISDL